MRSPPSDEPSDQALFQEILTRRAAGADIGRPLGELCSRWEGAARYVVRRIQKSYGRGAPDDELELYQEAVIRFMDRGLDQFRGLSERRPGELASPKTFFLRIVKHAAIDRYRSQREVLDAPPRTDDDSEASQESPAQVGKAMEHAGAGERRREDVELYWRAFERLEREHPNEASAWRLYHHEDLEDHTQVAERLHISVANSYKRVSRAQAWLRMYLLELQEEGR